MKHPRKVLYFVNKRIVQCCLSVMATGFRETIVQITNRSIEAQTHLY